MEKTLALVVSHRGLYPETEQSLQALKGATCIVAKGMANLAKARSMAFDQAFTHLLRHPDCDTLLSIDDDMVFKPEDVQRLIDLSRAVGHPQSAVAIKVDRGAGVIAARPRRGLIEPPRPRWWTGLACLAIPRAALEKLAPRLPLLGGIRVWCQTGEHEAFPGEWTPEDYWFCEHFGGVELAPIAVGHTKPLDLLPATFVAAAHKQGLERFTIWPDEETMTNVRLATREARA